MKRILNVTSIPRKADGESSDMYLHYDISGSFSL